MGTLLGKSMQYRCSLRVLGIVWILVTWPNQTATCDVEGTAVFCDTLDERIPGDLPPDIRSLFVQFRGKSAHLNGGHLVNYPDLEEVTLSGQLLSVAPGTFAKQTSLRKLAIIDARNLTYLPSHMFSVNSSIKELILERNGLTRIPVNIFDEMRQLEVLNIAFNCIELTNCTHIDPEFESLNNLLHLNLAGIEAKDFCDSSLNYTNFFLSVNKQLLTLNLTGAQRILYGRFSHTILQHFQNLEELDFSSPTTFHTNCPNKVNEVLSSLPPSLKRLYLRRWRSIRILNPRCFFNQNTTNGLRALPNLELLDLKYSDYIFGYNLDKQVLNNFTSLRHLNIGYCRISSIEYDAFQFCPNLAAIILDGNPLGSRQMRLQDQPTGVGLRTVSLKNIGIATDETQFYIPLQTLFTDVLTSVDFTNNFLRKVPLFTYEGQNNALVRENTCRINANRVNVRASSSPELRSITLDDNYLTSFVHESIKFDSGTLCANIPKLQNISISNNLLRDVVGLCPSLEYINLRKNELGSDWKRNSVALAALRRTKLLDISENDVENLSITLFSDMLDLEEIHAEGNRIQVLSHNLFAKNPRLRIINLAANELSSIEADILQPLSNLPQLRISNNQISRFSQSFLDQVEKSSIQFFEISGNHFACDCKLQSFQEWLNKSKTVFVPQHKEIGCYGDESGQKVYNYSRDTFACEALIPVAVLSGLLGSIGLTLLIALPCYKYRWYVTHPKVVWKAFKSQLKEIRFDQGCSYDAFISYDSASDSDLLFVKDVIIPAVERKHNSEMEESCRLYVHDRDSTLGGLHHTERCEAMEKSRKVLVVLSNSYINSAECRGEADLAGRQMYGQRFYQPNRILVIVRERLNDDQIVSPITVMLTEYVININDVNDEKTMERVWQRARQFLVKPRHAYRKKMDVDQITKVSVTDRVELADISCNMEQETA